MITFPLLSEFLQNARGVVIEYTNREFGPGISFLMYFLLIQLYILHYCLISFENFHKCYTDDQTSSSIEMRRKAECMHFNEGKLVDLLEGCGENYFLLSAVFSVE